MHENSPARRPLVGKRWFEKPLGKLIMATVLRQALPIILLLVGHLLFTWCKLETETIRESGSPIISSCMPVCDIIEKARVNPEYISTYWNSILTVEAPFSYTPQAGKPGLAVSTFSLSLSVTHTQVCSPSVQNPVALGLTSASHRHKASFDFTFSSV